MQFLEAATQADKTNTIGRRRFFGRKFACNKQPEVVLGADVVTVYTSRMVRMQAFFGACIRRDNV